MSIIIPDARWEAPALLEPGRKPTTPVEIDWENPFTTDLKKYVLASSVIRELVEDTAFPYGTSGGDKYTIDEHGQQLHVACEAAPWHKVLATKTDIDCSKPYGFIAECTLSAINDHAAIVGVGSGTSRLELQVLNSGAVTLHSYASWQHLPSLQPLRLNTRNILAGFIRPGPPHKHNVYAWNAIDGFQSQEWESSVGLVTGMRNYDAYNIGGSTVRAATRTIAGSHSWSMMFNRFVTEEEFLRLVRSQYHLLVPK